MFSQLIDLVWLEVELKTILNQIMPTLGPMCTDGTMCSLHMNFPPFLLGKTCLMCIFRDQNGAGLLGNHTASNEAGIRKSEIGNRLGLGIFGRPKLGLRQDMVLYQAYPPPWL